MLYTEQTISIQETSEDFLYNKHFALVTSFCLSNTNLHADGNMTSLVVQLVKNQPSMWETWVLFLGWEDPLEKGKATHSSILAWRIPWTV